MLKNIVFIIVLLATLSCGTRKRLMQRSSKKVNIEQQNDVSIIKTNDIVATRTNDISTDIHTTKTNNKIIFRPVDSGKPFYVDGKKYENVEIERKFTKEVDSSKIQKHTKEENKDNSIIEKEDKSNKKENMGQDGKKVDVKRDNSFGFWDWFWLLLAVVCVFFLVFKGKRIYGFLINQFEKSIL